MKVRMLQTMKGSPDGIQVEEYKVGEVYDLPPSLASVFLREKWAEQDKSLKGPSETKEVKGEAKAKNTPKRRAGKSRRG